VLLLAHGRGRSIPTMAAESMSLRDMLFWLFITLFGTGTYVIYGTQSVVGMVLGVSMMVVGFIGMAGCAWPYLKDPVSGKIKVTWAPLRRLLDINIIVPGAVIALFVIIGMYLYHKYRPEGKTTFSPQAVGDATPNPIDGLLYVQILPGTLLMGCSEGDDQCAPEEKPVRKVAIDKFKIGQTEVTVRAYKVYLQSEHRVIPKSIASLADNEPAGYVTWTDAKGYCLWSGGRLPGEAEWEYAARGGSPTARYDDIGKIAWYHGNSGEEAHPVGKKSPNGYGLYDVLGNVWEWTNDWYLRENDPEGHGNEKVLRGGSYHNDINLVRVSDRNRQLPDTLSRSIGVRCVQDE